MAPLVLMSDALNKAAKTSAKADAFENSLKPNEDWNRKLDNDMLRHRKSRANETAAQEKQRKDKDAEYQRKARSEETIREQNMRKQRDIDYHFRKRIEDKERAFDDRMEAYKEKNIEPLCMHGSYYRFLCFGSPRSTYYGCSLGSVDFCWLSSYNWGADDYKVQVKM